MYIRTNCAILEYTSARNPPVEIYAREITTPAIMHSQRLQPVKICMIIPSIRMYAAGIVIIRTITEEIYPAVVPDGLAHH